MRLPTSRHRRRVLLALVLIAGAVTTAAPTGHAAGSPAATIPNTPPHGMGTPQRASQFARSSGLAAVERANPRLSRNSIGRLVDDATTWVGPNDRLYVKDPMTLAPRPAAVTDPVLGAPHPLADTFLLNSRPGSAHTIYLDFNGAVVTSDLWAGANAGMPIRAEGLDFDGAPATFDDEERTLVQDVWARVAEDFATFDVNVTTQDPGPAALNRSSAADPTYGVRVVFSSVNPVIAHCGCAGIAFIGVFDEVFPGETPPAFSVMPDSPQFTPAFDLADIASHEVGHTLGLTHDGTTGATPTEYYGGHGIWAPIMGLGRRPLTQWSNGSYANANNTEDDLAVITSFGLPRVADDHGDSAAAATALAPGAIDHLGMINTGSDVDVFSFVSDGGPFDVSVLPAERGADTDLRLELRTADGGTVLASNNPVATVNTATPDATGTAAHVSVPALAAGAYTLWVTPTGQGSAAVDGYDTYGTIGRYRLISGTPTLSVTLTGSGSGQVLSDPVGIDCGTTCSMATEPRSAITLTVTAAPGSVFTGWGGACSGTGVQCRVSTDSPTTQVTAHFYLIATAPILSTTVDYIPDPAVFTGPRISSTPFGLECSLDFPDGCTAPFESGSRVILHAVELDDWTLVGWTGPCSLVAHPPTSFEPSPVCSVAMTQAQQVTASFVQGRSLTVDVTDPYYGSLSYSRPNACISPFDRYRCIVSAPLGSTITVTAKPTDQGRFVGWTGACTGTSPTCTVTMAQASSLTADFELSPRLTVTKPGTGNGTVTAAGTPLSCGATCVTGTSINASLVLRATPAAGSQFVRWNGPCESVAGNTCTVLMSTSRSVEAMFEKTADTFRAPTPFRAYDTRAGQRGLAETEFDEFRPIAASNYELVDILPVISAPAGSTLAVNVTAVGPAAAGTLQLFGCPFLFSTFGKPTFMSFTKGGIQAMSGLVTVRAGERLCLLSTATTHVVIDVSGWYPPGQTFVPLGTAPRLFDSRGRVRGALEPTDLATAFGAGTVRRFVPLGKAGVGASGVAALQLNLTAISPTVTGTAAVYPCSSTATAPPPVTTLTFTRGVTTSTSAVVTIGAAGGFCVRTTGATHLAAAATGWLRSGRGYVTFALGGAPRRLFDTRARSRGVLEPTDVAAAVTPGAVRRIVVAGAGGLPAAAGVGAIALSVTAVGPVGIGSVNVWPCTAVTTPPPITGVVTFLGGRSTTAGAIVGVASNGGICVSSSARTHLVIDGIGWFKR